ncbi:MAG: helix-turn-helix transcriptional regulator [Clostridia bacterium]|nr:helix-turn-helix transcriptional regulator [Clostridia bacterium]MBQ8658959.1 helix-turn-helix transcriptional regulator [Clostridia bacterium]
MTFLETIRDYGLFMEVVSVQKRMSKAHNHEAYEIYYLIHGDREYFIEDNFFHVSNGDFILVPKGKLHRTSGQSCTRIVISFSEEFLLKYYTPSAVEFLLQAFTKYHVHPEGASGQRVLTIFDEMKKLYTEHSDRIFILLAELLDILSCAPVVEDDTTKTSTRIREIVAYVNKHYGQLNGIQEVAEKFYLSKAYLCRQFKKTMGITFSDYLTKTKLYHSTTKLMTTNKKVSEIAEECGFHSCAYFCNIFKREYGITPIVYRQGHNQRKTIRQKQ